MAGFYPQAATSAYMVMLTPAQHARATAYTHGGEWLLLWGWLVTLASAWLILKSGVLIRLRDRIAVASKPRANRAAFVCALVFTAIDAVIELPWSIYSQWWREGRYGLTRNPSAGGSATGCCRE